MKRIACVLISLCLLAGVFSFASAAAPGFSNFNDKYQYSEGLFWDVAGDSWYRINVEKVYELGLMEGVWEGRFSPDNNTTIAQTVTLAARLHNIYHGGDGVFSAGEVWYQVYVDYARENGIIGDGEMDFSAYASRREFAEILCAAFPEEALSPINDIPDNSIPDVKSEDPGAEAIYKLYRAGVLIGNNRKGTYSPDSRITRAAVAAIITRMACPELRQSLTLKPYTGPDVPEQPAAGDEFFSDACIIGNSLVEGLRMYGQMPTMTYFSRTSMNVHSAISGRDFGYGVSAVDAMAAGTYNKIYIELGINEIGYTVDTFIGYYSRIIERVQMAQPGADVYILSLTPVSRYKDSGGVFTMARVNAYNEGLRQLAGRTGCYYIDCVTELVDESGFLPSADTWDGVHFNIPKYLQWADIIRTHYVEP